MGKIPSNIVSILLSLFIGGVLIYYSYITQQSWNSDLLMNFGVSIISIVFTVVFVDIVRTKNLEKENSFLVSTAAHYIHTYSLRTFEFILLVIQPTAASKYRIKRMFDVRNHVFEKHNLNFKDSINNEVKFLVNHDIKSVIAQLSQSELHDFNYRLENLHKKLMRIVENYSLVFPNQKSKNKIVEMNDTIKGLQTMMSLKHAHLKTPNLHNFPTSQLESLDTDIALGIRIYAQTYLEILNILQKKSINKRSIIRFLKIYLLGNLNG